MTETEFQALVEQAFAELPEEFRQACRGVAIRAVPFADAETLAALGLVDRYELLGLYHGINLAQKSVMDLPTQPDMVFLYREPIIAYAHAMHSPLADVVRHVLIHELGHHFGFSDEDMEAIETRADDPAS